MPDLLLELRSEEIPARMQRKAAGDLRKIVTDGLVEAGLTYEGCQEYWTPRRLTLDIRGVTARSRDVREEKKGPKVGAPQAAVDGFLRSAGLTDISQAHVHSDPKKGDFYIAHIVKPGRSAEDIIVTLVPAVIRDFPWPKSMRWGKASAEPGSLRWVRPLQSIVCTFGPETEEPVVVDFAVDGIRSGNVTYGHRFHAPGAITVRRFADYAAKLEAAKVIIDAERRKQIILADAENLAFANGLELVSDDGLLEEVAGLVEWPVVLMGEFEEAFLEIPAEVIRLTIRANQKCFVTRGAPSSGPSGHLLPAGEKSAAEMQALSSPQRGEGGSRSEPGEGALSNRFVLTANIAAKDGGKEIAHGNGKVVRARLSDALYFWRTDQGDLPDLDQLEASAQKFDLKRDAAGKLLPLDQRMARLDHLGVTFHAKLGTQGERVERIARLAEELAVVVARPISPLEGEMSPQATEGGAVPPSSQPVDAVTYGHRSTLPPSVLPDISPSRGEIAKLARRAAVLAKADLTTEVVGEFPELQGLMGRKYALLQGEHPSVAAAIEEHYKPQGPSDRVPTDPVSVAVALADKLDTLVGFWAIDEKPTGSKDPYALRRAALGVTKILLERSLSIPLLAFVRRAYWQYLLREARKLRAFTSAMEVVPLVNRVTDWGNLYQSIVVSDELEGELRFGNELHRFNEIFFQRRPLVVAWILGETPFDEAKEIAIESRRIEQEITTDLLAFFHDRLKVYLRDQGARHDLIDAVLASGAAPSSGPSGHLLPAGEKSAVATTAPSSPQRGEGGSRSEPGEGGSSNDDLLMIVRRVEALGSFLDSEDGKNLLAGTKRAANILAAEEKKGTAIAASVDPALFGAPAEQALYAAVNQAEKEAGEAIGREDFSAAMRVLSALREPVDSFFEHVLVNDADVSVRANRLALLARIRAATGQVADFSKIAG